MRMPVFMPYIQSYHDDICHYRPFKFKMVMMIVDTWIWPKCIFLLYPTII